MRLGDSLLLLAGGITAPAMASSLLIARWIVDEITPPPRILVRATANCAPVTVRQQSIRRIRINLIEKAIRHNGKPHGKITVTCIQRHGALEFAVADDGSGIDPKYHETVFGMFQTLAPRSEVETVGMGLCIARQIVESSGGRIWIESRPGGGSTFRFLWPRPK